MVITKTETYNPYRFQSIFCCITNFMISLLGSGKTILTIHFFISRLKKFPNAIGFTNVKLFGFPKEIQERIILYRSLLELKDLLKQYPKKLRKIILLDEAQNEFDRRKHGSNANIQKTIFLNFFRKFNLELYYNIVNENRVEFRLGDMSTHIFYPTFVNRNIIYAEAVLLGNSFFLKASFYFNKYETLEDIRTEFEEEYEYHIDKIFNDKMFKKMCNRKVKKKDVIHYIHKKFNVSQDTASLLYSMVVLKYYDKESEENKENKEENQRNKT
jgi:hypothetical protein